MDKHALDLDAERLFAGYGAAEDPDLNGLTRFVADLRNAYISAPAAGTRAIHLQALLATYPTQRIPSMNGASTNGAKHVRTRRRFALRATIAAAGLVLAGGSAMAATGSLPDAAQDAVSGVARHIGVKLPRAHKVDIKPRRAEIELPAMKVKQADDGATKVKGADESSDDGDSGTITAPSGGSNKRTSRTNRDDEPASDGSSDPAPDSDSDPIGGSSGDGRGDPSGGGGDGSGGSVEPGDGSGGDDGSGRGDPKDGSPGGADAPADDGTGDGGGGHGGRN